MKAHTPELLPLKLIEWDQLLPAIGSAHRELAYFAALLNNIPDAKLLLTPLEKQEAVLSSRIEGTQATLEEVLRFQAGRHVREERQYDIQEIVNYHKAMEAASKGLKSLPLSGRLLKKAHKILLSGVRGKNKTPGQFRSGSVFVGPLGKAPGQAHYIPPEAQHIANLFSNLEKYMHSKEKDILVQSAIVHAQFEIIHPFWDGNGRIGRLLIPLFLYSKKIISAPSLYLSEYLEAHQNDYYNNLNRISKRKDWTTWIIFFLKAIIKQSRRNAQKAQKIIDLKEQTMLKIQKATHSQYTPQIVNFISSTPWFTSTQLYNALKIPRPSISRLLFAIEQAGIIKKEEMGKGRRASLFTFSELLKAID